MDRPKLLTKMASRLAHITPNHPLRVSVDGIDAAGKTTFADELADTLQTSNRPIIRASIDGFHNPRHIRYQQGKDSPHGYFEDSYNYQAVADLLLKPLGENGNRQYKTAIFDYRTDLPIEIPFKTVPINAILIVDGIFLMRPELLSYWDFKIWIDVTFETALSRALIRDIDQFETPEIIQQRYSTRYFPAQRQYMKVCNPKQNADIIIDNNDPENPVEVLSN